MRWRLAFRPMRPGKASSGDGAGPLVAPSGQDDLRREVAANDAWYHTIELAPGVVTPGQVDLRGMASRILPADLSSRRALDVGTFDGFWAFEMERRGASVVAIDVDSIDSAEWPPLKRPRLSERIEELNVQLGRGFEIARRALGSEVERVICSVYDLESDAIAGPVDVAFLGALLLHLRDPVRALERIRSTLKPGGTLFLLEPISMVLTLQSPRAPLARFRAASSDFNWWVPNVVTVREWIRAAGFTQIRRVGMFRPPSSEAMRQYYVAYEASDAPR